MSRLVYGYGKDRTPPGPTNWWAVACVVAWVIVVAAAVRYFIGAK